MHSVQKGALFMRIDKRMIKRQIVHPTGFNSTQHNPMTLMEVKQSTHLETWKMWKHCEQPSPEFINVLCYELFALAIYHRLKFTNEFLKKAISVMCDI